MFLLFLWWIGLGKGKWARDCFSGLGFVGLDLGLVWFVYLLSVEIRRTINAQTKNQGAEFVIFPKY